MIDGSSSTIRAIIMPQVRAKGYLLIEHLYVDWCLIIIVDHEAKNIHLGGILS